jgi:hypothetical protein
MAAIEKGHQINHTGTKGGLKSTHQKAERHHALPISGRCLACCNQTPASRQFMVPYALPILADQLRCA